MGLTALLLQAVLVVPALVGADAVEADGATAIEGYATTFRTLVEGGADARRIMVGDSVNVHAVGRLEKSAKPFWSTRGSSAFSYSAGIGSVITGWDQGCLGARVGEMRELLIPSAEAVRVPAVVVAPVYAQLHVLSPPPLTHLRVSYISSCLRSTSTTRAVFPHGGSTQVTISSSR